MNRPGRRTEPGQAGRVDLRFIIDGVDGHMYAYVTDAATPRWEDAGMPSDGQRPNIGLGAGVVQPHAGQDYAPVALATDGDGDGEAWSVMGVGRWWWSRLGTPAGDTVVEQIGAVVITTDPTVTQTHVLLRTREGLILDAWYG
ncbi:hypothetical protein ACWEN6_26985 [Sphaerisporangium sp. NPDC004334]